MNKVIFLSSAILLYLAAACNPLSVDERYDISKLEKTVTVFPGVTVDVDRELFDLKISDLIEKNGVYSFFQIAGSDDPYLEEGDLYYRKEGTRRALTPGVETLYDGGGALFKNPFTVYLADVPGALHLSDEYHLSNPCIALRFTSDWLQPMLMDVTLNIGGKSLTAYGIPLEAMASQTVYISENGGYAGSAAGERDFRLEGLAAAISPLPYNISVTDVTVRGKGGAPYVAGTPVNLSLTGSFIMPAAFDGPSRFGIAVALNGLRIIPNDDTYRVGIYSIAARFEAVNSTPMAISARGVANDDVKFSFTTIKPGTADNPVTTEGEIILEYTDFDSISSLVTEIAASIEQATAQFNNKQGLKITLKSVTLPDGVEIEILDNNYGGNEQ